MVTVLTVSPHPDDEVIGAGATLVELRHHGHRVINLACSLGRPEDHSRRRHELERAATVAGFETIVLTPPASIGGSEDRNCGAATVAKVVVDLIDAERVDVVVGPHPHDGHHGHEAVARGVREALQRRPGVVWWMWGLWSSLPLPTLYVPYGEATMAVVARAVAEYRGENERNGYDRMMTGRAVSYRCLGSERVFGFGSPSASAEPFADLLTEARFHSEQMGWQFAEPRMLDPSDPLLHLWEPQDMSWWVTSASPREIRRTTASAG